MLVRMLHDKNNAFLPNGDKKAYPEAGLLNFL
jgi:hypothetical protein